MSAQPIWKFVANLGDADPIDYGGLFVYTDETGQYAPEMEWLERCDEFSDDFEIRRVCLDKCAEVDGLIVRDVDYARECPGKHVEWFSKSLARVADSMGTTRAEIVSLLCSDDPTDRAQGYRMIYDHHGWDNGDSYPLVLTFAEVETRYTDGEL